MNSELIFLQNLGLALLMGSLIGLERERNHNEINQHEFGGIRTMALVSILGYLAYSLFFSSTLLFAVLTGGYLLLLIASYIVSSYQNRNSGATTEIAGFFAYLIGILIAMGSTLYAAVITLFVVMILYFKEPLHQFAHRIGKNELYDTIKFIAVVFVVLPLLPDKTYGPLNILNPHEIWLIVALISAMSFASYVAIKLIGPRKGIGLGGFFGGFISSTAIAVSFSSLSKKSTKIANSFVLGIIIASSAMFLRVLTTVTVLNQNLLKFLLAPLLAMAGTGALFCIYFWLKKHKQKTGLISPDELHLKSPFVLKSAIQFGLLFSAMLFISKFASTYFGDQGIYLTAFFSGIVDVDAITVSMTNLSGSGAIANITASFAIIMVVIVNTLSKAGIVMIFASKEVKKSTVFALTVIAMVGIGSLIATVSIYGAHIF
ncbi:MAG: MgtC/SapB family protein [Candidatus Gracilibacteria bacterium]